MCQPSEGLTLGRRDCLLRDARSDGTGSDQRWLLQQIPDCLASLEKMCYLYSGDHGIGPWANHLDLLGSISSPES